MLEILLGDNEYVTWTSICTFLAAASAAIRFTLSRITLVVFCCVEKSTFRVCVPLLGWLIISSACFSNCSHAHSNMNIVQCSITGHIFTIQPIPIPCIQTINTLLYVKCKYSMLLGRFLVTWPSVMVHTDSKYHIDQAIFSNIVLLS